MKKIPSGSVNLIDRCCQLLSNNEAFVMAEVVQSLGSTPRISGARMAIRSNGEILGTIGGGIVEAKVIQAAAQVFQDQKDITKEFMLDKNISDTMDMICGGAMTVSLRYVQPKTTDMDLLKSIGENERKDRKRVILVGAGHVSKETAFLASYCGFETWVMDDRTEFANAERFKDAEKIVVLDDFSHVFDSIRIDKNTFIVILTRGHVHDKTVLAQALQTRAGYIGMIGSSKKRQSIFTALLSQGFTEEDMDRVFSPVGLSIGAQTPEEIGISITAQLIQVRARIS